MATFARPLVVGGFGQYIDNDVMDRMLQPDVIGSSPFVHVATTSEATALVFLDSEVNASHEAFIVKHPLVRNLLLPVCVGKTEKKDWVGHFVVLNVNLRTGIAVLHDSIGGSSSLVELTSHIGNLTRNILGLHVRPCYLVLGSSDQQVPRSNDCGVFCFRNVCEIVSCAHVLPFLGGVDFVGSFDFICRDVFRSIVVTL